MQSSKRTKNEVKSEQKIRQQESLLELRAIVLEEVHRRLDALEIRLDDPHLRAEEVSRILVESIVLKTDGSDQLTQALLPTVEEGLRESVNKNPRAIANSLFPIMGPALRKSILETIRNMVQSLNKVVEQSVSYRGLKWRWEAFRTGKTYGDIAFLHHMRYRVEQVYFIHRDSGLLLSHVVNGSLSFQDPDAVSAMLTAIQDFMKDSFNSLDHENVHSLQVGELTVWVESGPKAALAAVIRGNPYPELRELLVKVTEDLHLWHRRELETFDGNTAPFERSRDQLEKCLVQDSLEESQDRKPRLWIPGLLALLLLIFSGYLAVDSVLWAKRLNQFEKDLNAQPGLVITEVSRQGDVISVHGLRDKYARGLDAQEFHGKQLNYQLEPYWSLHPEMILKRASDRLQIPSGVRLSVVGDQLVLRGEADPKWIASLGTIDPAVIGVSAFMTETLVPTQLSSAERVALLRNRLQVPDQLELSIHEQNLILKGTVPFAWYQKYEQDLMNNAWDLAVDRTLMVVKEEEQLRAVLTEIEDWVCLFERGQSTIRSDQLESFQGLISDLQIALDLSESMGVRIKVEIHGHTDETGTASINESIAMKRAESVRDRLLEMGLNADLFQLKSWGSSQPAESYDVGEDQVLNRRVVLKVIQSEKGFRETAETSPPSEGSH